VATLLKGKNCHFFICGLLDILAETFDNRHLYIQRAI
jgi:hypothetical protein